MAAYLIAEIAVTDHETYAEYRARVPAVVAKYGGRYLVRGGAVAVLEGDGGPGRLVVLEFPDMAQARAFYDSQEYVPLRKLRQSAATGRVRLVEGA